MTTMCAAQLLSIQQNLAGKALKDTVTSQVLLAST